MNLRIKPFNAEVKQMYENHGHFHDGDAGLDVYVINEQTIDPGAMMGISVIDNVMGVINGLGSAGFAGLLAVCVLWNLLTAK